MKNAEDIIEKYRRSEELQKYLADASKALSSSLDYHITLQQVAKLAVPNIADWCGIEMLKEDGSVEQVAVAHKDPQKVKWAIELRKQRPVDMSENTGLPLVLKTGKKQYVPELTEQMLKAAIKNKKDLEIVKKIGGISSYLTVPLLDSGKKVLGAITYLTTESKKALTKVDVQMAEELAVRASLAISNALLYKTAQEAVLTRENFISIASHELKTPVTSMKTFTQVLQMRLKNSEDTESLYFLSKIDEQINKQTELITDLLDVSRIQRGKLELNITSFDMNALVMEIIEMIQATTTKHQIVQKGKGSKKIRADRERISQVLINLLTNAVKYSPKGGRVIVLISQTEKNIKISVQDFGIGIRSSEQDKIFGQFYQVNDPEQKTFPGLGIGLYISFVIVERHGGELKVKSIKGKGSTFSFTIPLGKGKL